MQTEDTQNLDAGMSKRNLAVLIPVSINIVFFFSAFLIGRDHSCGLLGNLYWWGGLLSLPVLFAVPFLCFPDRHFLIRLLLALLNVGVSIVIWAYAHDLSGMLIMCKLF